MPTTYQGNPANVSNALVATIIGASSTTPIVMQTNAPHGFSTNDLVAIAGVTGNTAANSSPNNPWTITVIDPTHFSLNGSVWVSGAYAGGGTATDVYITPPIQRPADGDSRNAASLTTPAKANADALQFVNLRLSKYQLLNQYSLMLSDPGGNEDAANWGTTPTSWSATTTGSGGAWAQCTSAFGGLFGSAFATPAPVCNQGDIFEIFWQTSCITTSNTPAMIASFISLSNVSAGAYVRVPGSGVYLNSLVTTASLGPSRDVYTVAAGGNAQTFGFGLYARANTGSALTVSFLGERSFLVNHYRSN